MAFSTSNPPLAIAPLGLSAGRSTGYKGGAAIFIDVSSDASGDIVATGYYRSMARVDSGKGAMPRGAAGMTVGDLLVHVESSAGAAPGKVSWHLVKATTAQVSAVSPLPAAAYSQPWDATVSAST